MFDPRSGSEIWQARLGATIVATYVDSGHIDASLSPRPYFHPLRTLSGKTVTAARPPDHRHHLGLSVSIPLVADVNFWGGRTYLRGKGYASLSNHGAIRHIRWRERKLDRFDEDLQWNDPSGRILLKERRQIRCAIITAVPGCWALDIIVSLHNATASTVHIASPGANGRSGAGYGGLFWRLPQPENRFRVFTATAQGEADVHGSTAGWLAAVNEATAPDSSYTLVFSPRDMGTRMDPWFVRIDDYPAIGSALAFDDPVAMLPAVKLRRRLRVYIADGQLSRAEIERLVPALDDVCPRRSEERKAGQRTETLCE